MNDQSRSGRGVPASIAGHVRSRWVSYLALALALTMSPVPAMATHLVVRTSDIVDAAVTTRKIRDKAVTASKIKNGAVKTNKIRDGAVTTSRIADAAVNRTKLAVPQVFVGSAQVYTANVTTSRSETCPAGQTLLSGGLNNSDGNLVVVGSRPSGTQGSQTWTVAARNEGATDLSRAIILICLP